MSTNGLNTAEDADMADCEGEKVVTMMDVLQEQQDFEDDANAVLGASDEKNCTYTKGYIKRQAIYACLTCCSDAKTDPTKRAGVCLACSLNCHENHELIELYTKRNFRCDCGNPKFNNHPCQFISEKPDLNEDNTYNHNFIGLYCTCQRPYPDPEATFEDEMIQCVICEDWLHSNHLDTNLPNEQYTEMICKGCMEKNEFLHDYSEFAVNPENGDVDIITLNNANTSVSNETSECDRVKVNGALENTNDKETVVETNKVDLASTESEQKAEEPADAEATDKIDVAVPEKIENAKMEMEIEDKTEVSLKEEETSDTTNLHENIPKETDNKDSIADNDNSKTDEINKEITEEMSKEASDENSIKSEDQSNENTLIASIEKLENELGNIESVQNGEVNKASNQTSDIPSDEKVEQIENVEKTEESNGTIEKTETETNEDKENNVEMNVDEETNTLASANNATSDNDQKETVENGSSEETHSEFNTSDSKAEENTKDIKRKLSTEDLEDTSTKKPKLDTNCLRPREVKRRFKGATFWPSNFRQKLCTCNECISMYKDLSVLFLTDLEDTVLAYETLGKEKIDGLAASQYEKGLEALSSLDRIQQINALTEYNRMRDKLLDFLKSFKERKEIVKEEDIKAFFAGMKPKREPDGVYFCR